MASEGSVREVDTRKLTRSPMVNAVWQLRFTSEGSVADGRIPLAIQKHFKHKTLLSQVDQQTLGFQVSVGQPPLSTAASVWRLASTTSPQFAVTLSDGVATLESSNYGSWSSFRPTVEDVVEGVEQSLAPGLMTRLGLRYVNVLFGKALGQPSFLSPRDLVGWVDSALLGFSGREGELEVGMLQGRQSMTLDGATVTLNYAMVQAEGGEAGLLIDVDSYFEHADSFATQDVFELSDRLHIIALSVFQRCVTPAAWEAMEPIDDAGAMA